jgi:prepilin-type N-terminal cleavage/methylation domain-containing protein
MRNRGRGYTLMELLLVMAIIVALAAVSAPAFTGTLRRMSLSSAADTVRAELTRAHVMAMRTGRIHAFQYEIGGGKYKIEPWIGGDDALESPDGEQGAQPAPAATTHAEDSEPTLPDGTKFSTGDAAYSSRSQRVEEEVMGTSSSAANWSRPILFYPDGSAGDAFIVVGNEYNAGIRVDLRGITASVRVGQISDLTTLESDSTLALQ